MSVYFVHAPASGLVKIGFATDAERRFSKIQSDSPTQLALLAIEQGDKSVEAALHVRFAQFRERGEWFRLEAELAEYVGSLRPHTQRPRKTKFGGPPLDEMAAAAGMSRSYVSQLRGSQRGNVAALIHLFHTTGWKHPRLNGVGEAELKALAERLPWRSQLKKQLSDADAVVAARIHGEQ